ncbi:acyl-CoA dehydrogenase family protein [Nocardia suismassiliense]|uniref:acyl-CoA dehydrogenase family protein n=1 Tax=Nocardia suismassiliense TaxID=2077092 RepID=UPI00131F2D17|nr:acyl-CoA dehydrogenase family protein [Nocardia suismassiliense]
MRDIVFGYTYAPQRRVRDALVHMSEAPSSFGSDAEEVRYGYAQLDRIGTVLGGSWVQIARNPWLHAATFDWTTTLYPRAAAFLSHSGLGIESILKLGNGNSYQQQCLAELDTGTAKAVFASTELSTGTNVLDLGTEAHWHREDRTLSLHTPTAGAMKWMPNVAEDAVPKIVIVLARLIVDGNDEGVFPIACRVRGVDGLAQGVEVAALPNSRLSAPMDHAAFIFGDGFRVPTDALLGGSWAQFTPSGEFVCDLDDRGPRFKRASAALQSGRILYTGAAVAAARAAWTLSYRYARQRMIDGTLLADRDQAQRTFISTAAQLVAMSTMVNHARMQYSLRPADAASVALVTAAKPVVTDTAYQALIEVSQLCGAQGVLGENMFGDWAACIHGVQIAEGINNSLRVAVGRAPQLVASGAAAAGMDISRAQIPGLPAYLPWWHELLHVRERAVVDAAAIEVSLGGTAIGADSLAVDAYTVMAERLVADIFAAAVDQLDDPRARAIAENLVAVFVLERVSAAAGWFTATGNLTVARASELSSELAMRYTALIPHLGAIAGSFDIPPLSAPIDHDYLHQWPLRLGWQGRWS